MPLTPLKTMFSYPRLLLLFSLFLPSVAGWVQAAEPAPGSELRLIAPAGYLPAVPILVRVEVIHPVSGRPDRDLWDAEATLTTDQPGITLSTNRVLLRNGLGSALVQFTGGGDFTLTATVGSLSASRPLQTRSGAPVLTAGGSLAANTTWTGVVQVTSTVTVPAGRVLTIESNTLILFNGVASGTAGVGLIVNGTLNSLGTEAHPVTMTCADALLRWGQIRHDNAQPSLYRYTIITRGGRAPGEGHTGQAPVVRPNNSAITFENCSLTDHAEANGTPGKIGYAINSDLTFRNCLLARARMGPEIQGTALQFTNSWILDMHGPDDSDGIYLHDQQVGQQIRLADSVIGFGDDDGVDTLSADVTLENCIIRNWPNPNEDAKGISAFNRTVTVKRCLIVDCWVGVSGKTTAGSSVTVNIQNSTIIGISNTVAANFKSNAPGPVVDFRITNSILRGIDALKSDFGSTNFTIGYCNISEAWPGTGNTTVDPLFVNEAGRDFHLRAASPVINAGDPASALDADGSLADLGYFPFLGSTNSLILFGSAWKYLDNGTDQGTGWTSRTFDDSTWASGPAQLGYGDGDEATVVSFGPNANGKYVTTYFRRSFTIGDAGSYTNLALRLLRDDGGVVHLNGTEIFRSANMPGGPIAFNTFAVGTGENDIDTATVNSALSQLVDGVNVIAVELHQQALNSSDVSFDFELTGITGVNSSPGGNPPPAVAITSPANDAIFTQGATIPLAASASDANGSVVKVEFLQNGSKLGEDISSPFTFDWINVPAGLYALTAVATDNEGATTTSSAINIVVNSGNEPTVNILLPTKSVWKYLDNGSDQGTAWIAPGFDDASWQAGPAELGYGDGDEATVVGFGPNAGSKYPTTYFRTTFVVTDPLRILDLTLSVLRDDGAIAYLNGTEVFRLTMPPGPVTYQTYATSASEYSFESTVVSPSLLVAGTNVLAVEVHQGNGSSSDLSFDLELAALVSAETNSRPIVSITSPANNTTLAAPGTVNLTAAASDADGSVDNVAFYANTTKLVDDSAAPFAFAWNNVPAGVYALTAVATDNVGQLATSAVVNLTISTDTAPPVVLAKSPAPGNVTNLTAITVTFSKPVVGVNASDLLVNGTAASVVNGAGSSYTFGFAQPTYGAVTVRWASGHGITDVFTPPAPFDTNSAGAIWNYTLLDAVPPQVVTIDPVPGSTVAALTNVALLFTEAVTGVNATDLRINGVPASTVAGSGAGPYVFGFLQPAAGVVAVAWGPGHGIVDTSGNAFNGGGWSYSLDPNASGILISEIMYHPQSENVLEEYIELYNRGAAAVNLAGWRLSAGVQFTFPSVSIPANGYLVVCADVATFNAKYPGVNNVVGNWTGFLNNSAEDIDLDDATGQRVDSVAYADEGDWAVRQRGPNDVGQRGWIWFKEHDGFGKSLELINLNLSNNSGQNWKASVTDQGTPGRVNSVFQPNIAPLILEAMHFPIIPKSAESLLITARIVDEAASSVTVTLNHRLDGSATFSAAAMHDDGLNGDAAASDGIYSALLGPQANNAILEYYISAADVQGNTRTWPAPVIAAVDGTGPTGQVANALLQVDNTVYNPTNNQPLYKFIMTAAEAAQLASIPCSGSQNSDAQMNVTFIAVSTSGTELRYLVGLRNRGHGSRCANPPNYRLSLRSDERWNDVTALNLNSVNPHIQHLGSVVSRKAGAVGSSTVAVQVRINNQNRAPGSYAAVEALNGDWAEHHFPFDGNGNVYRVIRDIFPPDFSYRGELPTSYQNTWFKESNESENDWSDLIGMLRVAGINNATPFTTDNVRQVINVEQWLRHLAVMNILGNAESGLNTGYNDDYYMYRGVSDPRFILSYHDLDSVLGVSSLGSGSSIFTATANNGSGLAMDRLINWPDFQPIYFSILQELMNTTFAQANFDALVDQTLGGYVTSGPISSIKSWMNQRRASVLSQIPPFNAPAPAVASVTGVPRSPTFRTTASLVVGGTAIAAYRYSLNGGEYGTETAIATPITLSGLANGTHTVSVIGRNTNNVWQPIANATVSSWVVNTSLPSVRLNEVLAINESAVSHSSTFPDLIELFNEGVATVDLSGLRLTDDPANPNKFTFPAGTSLAAGAYLTVWANNPDGTGGYHAGFSLDGEGEGVYLYHRSTAGGALLDGVSFGRQVANLAIGRFGSAGEWLLSVPTLGAANVAQATGNPRALKLNEWLASGLNPYPEDFIELFNPESLPVAMGGLHLTDQPIGAPGRSPIAPLSFIPANGFAVFVADGNSGPTHANFKLSIEQGELGLMASDLTVIDSVIYGPQQTDVSMGRCGDGAVTQRALVTPTPGAPNACPVTPPAPQLVYFATIDQAWRYDQSGSNLGTAWIPAAYDDSAWPSGPALLGFDNSALPEPFRTVLTLSNTKTTYYFRATFNVPANLNVSALQVRHIIDDGAIVYINGNEVYRVNMPAGPATATTLATLNVGNAAFEGPFTIPLNSVVPGNNVIAVELHQNAPNSGDLAFGLELAGVIVTNTPTAAGVVINEVLANNVSLEEADGAKPDWVEIYNPSQAGVDLADMSLTDDTLVPRRWVFPAGSLVPAQGFLKVRFDADLPASTTNTGFGLKAASGAVYLFNRPVDGGTLASAVTYGLQAADFSLGRVPNGSATWVLTVPSMGGPNLAATLGDPTRLKINEWMASPASGEDWFEVFNPNAQPVDVSGFWLSDDVVNRQVTQLPPRSFIGAGLGAFQRFEADNSATSGAEHVGFRLSASGEALALSNPGGALIHGLSFGPQATGVSEGYLPDGASSVVAFSSTATPGKSNFLPLSNVVVNEILSHTDAPLEDAVELYNPSGDDVNIGGWYLSDSQNDLFKYILPPNTIVPAGGYRVLYEIEFNTNNLTTPFSFSSSKGDDVYLSQAVGGVLTGYRAFAEFGAAENGVSFGRFLTSVGPDFTAMSTRTFGADNPSTLAQFRGGTGRTNAYPKIGPVVINEIMYHPADTNDALEYIELHNVLGTSVPLFDPANTANTWRLRKGVDFNFPAGITLPPGGFIVVVSFDPATDPVSLATFQTAYGSGMTLVGPYQGKLDNAGEAIELQKPDAPQTAPGPDFGTVPRIVVDRVVYSDSAPWPTTPDGGGSALVKATSALYGNEPLNWLGASPTPGAANFSSGGTNTPPVLAAIGNRSISEGSLLTFTATALDTDSPAQTLTFSLDTGAPSAAGITSGGIFTWTPDESDGPGVYTVTIRVTDNGAPIKSDSETITITVGEVNSAPFLNPIGNKAVSEGTPVTFTATSIDSDLPAQSLTYSLDAGAPAAATLHATTGSFSWTPGENDGPGIFTVTVRVRDNGSPARDDFETITITVGEVNTSPVLGLISDKVVSVGQLLSFTATATDPDQPSQNLSYSLLAGAPQGAGISAAGAFTWTPNATQGNTTNAISVRVTDNGVPQLSDTKAFSVVVVGSPKITRITHDNGVILIEWNSYPGKTYRVQAKPDLSTVGWSNVGSTVTATGPSSSLAVPVGANNLRFFRVTLMD